MRVYSAANEEALRTRGLLRDWAHEGLLNQDQYAQMERESVCELRRTNVFLRAVMLFFTVIIVAAVTGLFFYAMESGILLLIFAAVAYGMAEAAAARGLYRYGVEEALLVCAVGLLCIGMLEMRSGDALVAAFGAIASLWIWHRFGLPYAFLAATLFSAWLASEWAATDMAEHLIAAGMFAMGLGVVIAMRPRYRFTYLDERFSIAEALLSLGVYAAINLELWWWGGGVGSSAFPQTFYWSTWILTWCIPPVILYRGVRGKDRFVIWVGGLTAIVTLATNKSYLKWERHTWDPMLLGALLIGIAVFLRRRLENVRDGFTAQRLTAKDKQWMSVVSVAVSASSQHATPHSTQPDTHLGHGGASGGGGASSDF